MKKKKAFLLLLMLPAIAILNSCNKSDDDAGKQQQNQEPDPIYVGNDGNPRFNLVFTNSENVDLDLYVKTPAGNVIYYQNLTADNGTLDVDCLCDDCPQGPNENIYWEDGTGANGTYTYWVNYYGNCGEESSKSSDFTLRLIKNGKVIETKTGTLSEPGSTQEWTYEHVN